MNKAAVLVNRVNMFWDLGWEARSEFLNATTLRNPDREADVVIGCVATRAARQIIEKVVTDSSPVSYLLDLIRFFFELALPILEAPTQELRPLFEAHRAEVRAPT